MRYNKETRNKLYGYFTSVWGMYPYRRGWLKGDCPSCGAHKFGVHLGKAVSNCFKCGSFSHPKKYAEELEGLQPGEILSVLDSYRNYVYKEPKVELKKGKSIELPKGYHLLMLGDSKVAQAARSHVKSRGFDVGQLSARGFGYYTDESNSGGYLLIPWYANGKLVFWNARLVLGFGPKYKYPDVEDLDVNKRQMIYNSDTLYLYKRIYIVESWANAETIGENAVALGGKKESKLQFSNLINSPVEKFIIALDPDATQEAFELASRLSRYKRVKVVVMTGDKDVNDLGRKIFMKITQRFKYLKAQQFIINANKFKKRSLDSY